MKPLEELPVEAKSAWTLTVAAITGVVFLFSTFALKSELSEVRAETTQAGGDLNKRLDRLEGKVDHLIERLVR